MKKFLIVCALILSVGLNNNLVMASEKFESTRSNTKSGKEYGIKEEYQVRELENGELEIEFKKGVFTSINKDEISTIVDLDVNLSVDKKLPDKNKDIKSTRSTDGFIGGFTVKNKVVKFHNNSSYFPYSRYYEEYDSSAGLWYSGTLKLDNVVCINSTTYVATYKGTLVASYK